MKNQINNFDNIISELTWRNLLKQYTNNEKIITAQKQNKGVYCGFDPTGDSLHVGHLIQIMLLLRFQKFGFTPIAVIGGGTGMIGDPSGKKSERVLLTKKVVTENVKSITKQLTSLIPDVKVVNNNEWLKDLSLLDFLRDVGKYFNISYLLNKESIATRIESGLSVTEFLYTLLQAYDFLYLYKNYDCTVQIGGSDQWGNITSGIELITKVIGETDNACGLTMNLLTKTDGTKFGKTESGAVWLNSEKTSPYEFYQFFLNQDDNQAQKLLFFLTFFSQNEISKMLAEHENNPKARICQNRLAEFLTEFVHGKENLQIAERISNLLFKNNFQEIIVTDIPMLKQNIPFIKSINNNLTLIEILVYYQIVASNRIARELIEQKAIMVNGQIMENPQYFFNKKDLWFDKYLLIKRGKRNYFLFSI